MSGQILILLLLGAIAFIVLATARFGLHPFLVLIATGYALGLAAGLSVDETIAAVSSGFGATIGHIGIVIAAGTIIGHILEKSGGAVVMANTVVRWVGQTRSALAMSITGAVVSIPVFCDSGFVILSSLARSLATRAKQSLAFHAVALSLGLYTTHVFVPPTPGPIAAAGALGADIGMVILFGILVTIPVIAATYLFARFMGRRIYIAPDAGDTRESVTPEHLPSPLMAFLPILVPIVLIALKSVAELPSTPLGSSWWVRLLVLIGHPNGALLAGVAIAFASARRYGKAIFGDWVNKGLVQAGTIILITGAGGALGEVLKQTDIGEYLGITLASLNIGIFVPFIIAAGLKSAQGSSTVAIITTASLVTPLLAPLGLDSGHGPVLVTLAIGAGAMTVSHANDSFFWVVSQLTGMKVSEAYKLQTLGTGVGGVTGMVAVFLLSLMIL